MPGPAARLGKRRAPPSKKEKPAWAAQRAKHVSKKRAREQTRETIRARIAELETSPAGLAGLSDFDTLPLSAPTLNSLRAADYATMTEIQRAAIPVALKGRDILGAAKTGSGKTLAFLVPLLEKLWREKWSAMDGLGALVISPTRELAVQIFNVLCKAGREHDFSAGLLIGGKDLRHEQERLGTMNIVVATPGRLLQHIDQTPDFNVDNLQMLVLDEADRILDAGFAKTLAAILKALPKKRQTLLFSATQTKSVRDLARMGLTDPEYIAVHEKAVTATPEGLTQYYLEAEVDKKIDFLYSFLRSHLNAKTLVFVTSAKQARFVFETMRRMRPGIIVASLYGSQSQDKRLEIQREFAERKAMCLIATDVAARGLDFPAVDWVIQLDCPEGHETYLHRVGRTARYNRKGSAILVLRPSEKPAMLALLEQHQVQLSPIQVNPNKMASITPSMAGFCAQSPEYKHLAQKAFINYVRSIHFQSNKKVFTLAKFPATSFAMSLGLLVPPRVMLGRNRHDLKNQSFELAKLANAADDSDSDASHADSDSDVDDDNFTQMPTKKRKLSAKDAAKADGGVVTRMDRMFSRQNQLILTEGFDRLRDATVLERSLPASATATTTAAPGAGTGASSDKITLDTDDDDEETDLLFLKQKDHALPAELENFQNVYTATQLAKQQAKLIKKGASIQQKTLFDEDGVPRPAYALEHQADVDVDRLKADSAAYLASQKADLKAQDTEDKKRLAERRRALRIAEKEKAKRQRAAAAAAAADEDGDEDGGMAVTLGPRDSDSDSDSDADQFDSDAEVGSDADEAAADAAPAPSASGVQRPSTRRAEAEAPIMDDTLLDE